MPGPWDSAGKRLLREMPQHVVTWLMRGATFVRTLPTELKSRNIFADGVYEITVDDQPALMHIEFQSRQHKIMPERLLEYNVLASSENDWWPVYTFVIYLRKDGEVPQSPLIRKLRRGEEYQRFYYTVIEMANISARQLLQMGLHGLYPLILLAQGGTEPEIVREMVTDLTEARELELLALAYTFGGLAPGSEAYESWFRRSFAMLDDILEDSWTYQEIIKKGQEKERHQQIHEHRSTLLNFVHMRFPELIDFAEPYVETIKDTTVLLALLNQLFTVQTAEEAKQAIIDASTEDVKKTEE
jgi:hypothetical protein